MVLSILLFSAGVAAAFSSNAPLASQRTQTADASSALRLPAQKGNFLDGLVATAEAFAQRLAPAPAAYNASRVKPGDVVRCGAKRRNESRVEGWTTRKPSLGGFGVEVGGAAGDYNHYRSTTLKGTNDRALSLLTTDVLGALNAEGWPAEPGDLGENLLVSGLGNDALAVGRRFLIGESVLVEITEPIVPCAYLCTLPYLAAKWRCADFLRTLRGRRGWYARVLAGGFAGVGDRVQAVP